MIPTLKQVRLKEFGYLPVGAKVTNGTVSYVAGRFYVSVVVDIDEKSKYNKDLEASYHTVTDGVGIDLGVKDLAIVSGGKVFKNINKRRVQRSNYWRDGFGESRGALVVNMSL